MKKVYYLRNMGDIKMEAEKIREEITRARDEQLEQLRDSYATRNDQKTAGKYILGLMNDVEQKNGWQLSEQLSEDTHIDFSSFYITVPSTVSGQ